VHLVSYKQVLLVLNAFGCFQNANTKSEETWNDLSEKNNALIKRYQSLKETQRSSCSFTTKNGMVYPIPEEEKQKMRDAWQKMSTQERNDLRKRMQNAS
jgi:hypothetical protein